MGCVLLVSNLVRRHFSDSHRLPRKKAEHEPQPPKLKEDDGAVRRKEPVVSGSAAGEVGGLAAMESLWRLKRFDAFPKTLEDFRVKTCGGALGEGCGGACLAGRDGG